MPIIRSRLLLLSVLLSASLSGCGFIGAPAGSFTESFNQPQEPVVTDAHPDTPILVAISYPAVVTPRAKRVLQALYDEASFAQPRVQNWEKNPQAMQDALIKTPYYAHEFYRTLTESLPPERVVMFPAIVDLDGRELVYRNLNHGVPAVVNVDFMVYRSRDENGGYTLAGTQDNRVLAMIEVRTHPSAAPATAGVLAVNDRLPVLPADRMNGQPSVLLAISAIARGDKGVELPIVPAIHHEPDKVIGIPLTEYTVPRDDWKAHMTLMGHTDHVLAKPYFAALSNVVLASLRRVDPRAATAEARAAYRAQFDPQLDRESPQRRALKEQVLAQFEREEAALLAKASAAPLREAFDGEWGDSVRQRLVAELDLYDKQQRRGWMALGMGLLTMGVAGPMAWSPAATAAMLEASDAQSLQSFQSAFAVAFQEQQEVAIAVGNDTVRITGSNLGEVREKLQQLYDAAFPQVADATSVRRRASR